MIEISLTLSVERGSSPNQAQNAVTPRRIKVWENKWHHVLVRVFFEAEKENIDLWLGGKRVGAKTAFYARPLNTTIGRQWYFGARNAVSPKPALPPEPLHRLCVFARDIAAAYGASTTSSRISRLGESLAFNKSRTVTVSVPSPLSTGVPTSVVTSAHPTRSADTQTR